jgi:hypothetical protein
MILRKCLMDSRIEVLTYRVWGTCLGMRAYQNSHPFHHLREVECCRLKEPKLLLKSPSKFSIDRAGKILSKFLIFHIVFLMPRTGHATQLFPWGNSNILAQCAATNSQGMVATASQGNIFVGQAAFQNVSFRDVADIQSAFQEELSVLAGFAVSNSAINPTNPILVNAYTYNDFYNGGYSPFDVPDPLTFNLVMSNGKWTAPDLSGLSLILPQQIVTVIPGMKYCRIEIYSNGMTAPFRVVDSTGMATSSDASIDITNGSVTIDTQYLASENGILGPYSLIMTIITDSNGLQEIDGNGDLIPEPLLRIVNFSMQNGIASFNVVGGDPARVFVIQGSTNLTTWLQVGGPYTVGTNANWSITFQDTTSNNFGFYRTATTNAVPQ